jgi:glutathione synthase/RimK-type ligase-like ATP-grasp enzyme
MRAVPVIWDDPRVDWTAFSAVVIRSCWDYYLRHADFLAWVAQLEAAAIPLWNPPSVLRWNAEKTYLCELARRGVSVIPTRLVEQREDVSLVSVLEGQGWERAVVKPTISAAAHDTWCTSRASAVADEARFQRMVTAGRVLVQPFVDVVRDHGELSLLFFGGAYSHAVRKVPRTGDFRVQEEHGGTSEACEPAADIITQAEAVLSAGLPGMGACLYARVDGCVVGGRFTLMELELIEPALFLGAHPAAPDRFASALLHRMS